MPNSTQPSHDRRRPRLCEKSFFEWTRQEALGLVQAKRGPDTADTDLEGAEFKRLGGYFELDFVNPQAAHGGSARRPLSISRPRFPAGGTDKSMIDTRIVEEGGPGARNTTRRDLIVDRRLSRFCSQRDLRFRSEAWDVFRTTRAFFFFVGAR